MKFKRRLRCQLTDHELKERAQSLIEHLDSIDELTQQKKDAVKRFSDRISGEEAAAARLRAEITDETELRDVDCVEVPMFGPNIMATVRLDTYAVINRRAMRPSEQQEKLFEDREQSEIEELNRLGKIIDLSDLLTEIKRPVNTQCLATLDGDKLNELTDWATGYKAAVIGETDLPAEPDWLEPLLQATLETQLTEKELQIRVDTIHNLLQAQSIEIADEEISSWTKAQQDEVMHWSDSLNAAEPLPRPEFLPKPKKDGKEKPDQQNAADQGDNTATTGESEAPAAAPTVTAPETTQPASEGDSGASPGPEVVTQSDDEAAAQNGELLLSRGDLFDMITQAGVEVRLETVEAWDTAQADLAYQWAKESLEALNDGRERQPAPPFFFG